MMFPSGEVRITIRAARELDVEMLIVVVLALCCDHRKVAASRPGIASCKSSRT